MHQIKPQVPKASNRKKSGSASLDRFEQICRIIDQYLRWPVQLIAIVVCYIFINDPEVARNASLSILALGSTPTIRKLIDKIPGPN